VVLNDMGHPAEALEILQQTMLIINRPNKQQEFDKEARSTPRNTMRRSAAPSISNRLSKTAHIADDDDLPALATVSASNVMCCAVLCCAVLCCAVLCCAVMCCAVLCCAVRRTNAISRERMCREWTRSRDLARGITQQPLMWAQVHSFVARSFAALSRSAAHCG
jgi:hypothetical protein